MSDAGPSLISVLLDATVRLTQHNALIANMLFFIFCFSTLGFSRSECLRLFITMVGQMRKEVQTHKQVDFEGSASTWRVYKLTSNQ